MRKITATDLGRQLSDVLNRVFYQRETVLVERGGKPVCRITPAGPPEGCSLAHLIEVLHGLPEMDKALADAVRLGIEEQDTFEGIEWPRSSTRAS